MTSHVPLSHHVIDAILVPALEKAVDAIVAMEAGPIPAEIIDPVINKSIEEVADHVVEPLVDKLLGGK